MSPPQSHRHNKKYSGLIRLVRKIPGLREGLAGGFMRLPRAVSPTVHRVMQRFVFVDQKRRTPVFEAAFTSVLLNGPAGDYLEFGVARGTSLIGAFRIAARHGLSEMRFHAFDSFEGLPSGDKRFQKGQFAYAQEVFARFCDKAGVDMARVTMTPGFYDKSLGPKRASELGLKPGPHIVHVDCDLYESTVDVLRFLEPLLTVGAVIIFDDWFVYDDETDPYQFGEKRAFTEWSARAAFEPLAITYPWNAAFHKVR